MADWILTSKQQPPVDEEIMVEHPWAVTTGVVDKRGIFHATGPFEGQADQEAYYIMRWKPLDHH